MVTDLIKVSHTDKRVLSYKLSLWKICTVVVEYLKGQQLLEGCKRPENKCFFFKRCLENRLSVYISVEMSQTEFVHLIKYSLQKIYAVDGVVILALKGCMESRFCLRFCVLRVEENASDVCVCAFFIILLFLWAEYQTCGVVVSFRSCRVE